MQLDSICSNELDGPDIISKAPGRKGLNHFDDWTDEENLQPLNLVYEATPYYNISLIITEYGLLPPTSVPGIVRDHLELF